MSTFVTIHHGILSSGHVVKDITLPLVSPIISKSGLPFHAKFRGTFDSSSAKNIPNRINLRVLFRSDRDFSCSSVTSSEKNSDSEIPSNVLQIVSKSDARTDQEIIQEMSEKFEAINLLTNAIGCGKSIRSLVVSGSPGTGKSFSVFHELKELKKINPDLKFIFLSGTISPIKLYITLWENSEKNNIIVLDDCDAVVEDMEALNMIKAATDTKKIRTIHYNKKSTFLEENGIPNLFDYNGGIIYLSNINFAQEVERKTNLAVHVEAFISRSLYINVTLNSSRERMLRIRSIIYSELFKQENKLLENTIIQIDLWLKENETKLTELSIRTAVKLANVIKEFPTNWEKIAKHTLCRSFFNSF